MTVTKIEAIGRTKWKVELDGEFAFVLYKGELKRFGIQEEAELSEELYEKIRKEVILKRAKLRAMHLLTDMARTEKNLREKLCKSLYPDDIVDAAIAYVRSSGIWTMKGMRRILSKAGNIRRAERDLCGASPKRCFIGGG